MSSWVVFDDDDRRLAPLTDLRASFEVRTGALTTLERLSAQMASAPAAIAAPAGLAILVGSRLPLRINQLPDGDTITFLNGRLTSLDISLPAGSAWALLDDEGAVIAARLERSHAARFLQSGCRDVTGCQRSQSPQSPMLRWPWEALTHAARNLPHDLKLLRSRLTPLDPAAAKVQGVIIVGEHPVLLGRGATVHPHVVFDTSAGPIAIDDEAQVRSMSVLVGPGYVGRGSAIANHAHIRGRCVIGPVCKVGGEVNASLFQGHSNKAHSGYLGNSFIGEWVNLGADTVTSNLKNTYGEVRVQLWPGHAPQATGLTNLGSILGDHVKTAIGTRLLTGSIIHIGAMLATSAFPPKSVRPFAFLTDEGEAVYDLDKFCEVANAMMGRRDQSVTDALRRRLADLWAQGQAAVAR